MYRRLVIILVWIGLGWIPNPAGAVMPLSDYNALRDVFVQEEGDDLLVRFEFKKPLTQQVQPQFFKRSVQMDLNLTYVDPPKRYFPVNAGPISQVYVSQFDPEMMRIRFMLENENGVNAHHFRIRKEGRYLNVRIPKRAAPGYDEALDRLLERAVGAGAVVSEPVEENQPEPSLDTVNEVLSRVRHQGELEEADGSETAPQAATRTPLVLRDRAPAAVSAAATKATEQPDGKSSPPAPKNLEVAGEVSIWGSALRMVSMLALVVGLMFLLVYGFKKWVMKQGVFGGGDKPIRVISTGFLGPKKSIALVEVAGKVLVLGVANDQISLLSSLEEGEELDRLLNGNRNGKAQSAVPDGTETPRAPAASRRKASDTGVDVYAQERPRRTQTTAKTSDEFSDYVQQYSEPKGNSKQSVESIKRLIRQRMDRMKAGV